MRAKMVNIIQPRNELDKVNSRLNPIKKRVCAYCRVSTDNTEQKTSYDAQVDEYTNRIISNPNWEFIKVYADEGISGTSTKGRKEFNNMIEDAKSGEIDLILTKSISRFARNTVDCLSFIRELRLINVEIYFEKENIYSSDPKVDFLLTIMSSIAQEEARNISENIKWNVQKRFKDGVPILNTKRFLGYTKDKKGGNLVIDPQEAKIVKLIFKMYIEGIGLREIAEKLVELGYKTGAGHTVWRQSAISAIIKNEKYCGDLLQQKTITLDYLSHKRVKNREIVPKYLIENNHEPIIDKETFELAQKIRKDRGESKIGENKNRAKYSNQYPFTFMLICNRCGRTLKRRYWNYGSSAQRVMQQCGNYLTGKGNCDAKAVYQDVLEGATIQMLNELFVSKSQAIKLIKDSINKNITVSETEIKINEIKKQIEENEQLINNLIDIKVKNPQFDDVTFTLKYNELSSNIKVLNDNLSNIEKDSIDTYDTKTRLNRIEQFLKSQDGHLTELNTEILKAFIYKIIIIERDEVVFCIAAINNYNDNEFIEKRHEFIKSSPIHEGIYNHEQLEKRMKYSVVII